MNFIKQGLYLLDSKFSYIDTMLSEHKLFLDIEPESYLLIESSIYILEKGSVINNNDCPSLNGEA